MNTTATCPPVMLKTNPSPPSPTNCRPARKLLHTSTPPSPFSNSTRHFSNTLTPHVHPMPRRSDSPLKPKHPDHHHPRTCLLLAILSLQLLLLLLSSRSLSISISISTLLRRPNPSPRSCPLGRIYVYDLPSFFNADLVSGCDDLNPWNSRCSALSNSGFGLPSAADLASVVPAALLPAWYATDQFAAELIYHRRALSHPCRTTDPSAADAFYVPFYAGLAVGKYLWNEKNNFTARDRDRHCSLLLDWVRNQPPYRNSGGWDHFLMLGRITWDFRRSKDDDWGGSFLHMTGMENVTRLLIERNPWDNLDVGVPYPTGFHPRTILDVKRWQHHVLTRNRTTLFSFAGAARAAIKDDFRRFLLSQCANNPGLCKSVDCSNTKCSNSTSRTLGLFLESDFCLQPRGDSFTRRSIFDCMVAGAIPVFFWKRSAYVQYELFLPGRQEEYSMMVDRRGVRNGTVWIGEVLKGLGEEKIRRMRENVVELIPRLVYSLPEQGLGPEEEKEKDAFEVAVDGVLRRFRARKMRIKMGLLEG